MERQTDGSLFFPHMAQRGSTTTRVATLDIGVWRNRCAVVETDCCLSRLIQHTEQAHVDASGKPAPLSTAELVRVIAPHVALVAGYAFDVSRTPTDSKYYAIDTVQRDEIDVAAAARKAETVAVEAIVAERNAMRTLGSAAFATPPLNLATVKETFYYSKTVFEDIGNSARDDWDSTANGGEEFVRRKYTKLAVRLGRELARPIYAPMWLFGTPILPETPVDQLAFARPSALSAAKKAELDRDLHTLFIGYCETLKSIGADAPNADDARLTMAMAVHEAYDRAVGTRNKNEFYVPDNFLIGTMIPALMSYHDTLYHRHEPRVFGTVAGKFGVLRYLKETQPRFFKAYSASMPSSSNMNGLRPDDRKTALKSASVAVYTMLRSEWQKSPPGRITPAEIERLVAFERATIQGKVLGPVDLADAVLMGVEYLYNKTRPTKYSLEQAEYIRRAMRSFDEHVAKAEQLSRASPSDSRPLPAGPVQSTYTAVLPPVPVSVNNRQSTGRAVQSTIDATLKQARRPAPYTAKPTLASKATHRRRIDESDSADSTSSSKSRARRPVAYRVIDLTGGSYSRGNRRLDMSGDSDDDMDDTSMVDAVTSKSSGRLNGGGAGGGKAMGMTGRGSSGRDGGGGTRQSARNVDFDEVDMSNYHG